MKEKTKKKSVSSLKKKAWILFSTYIRLRDCLKTTGSTEYENVSLVERFKTSVMPMQVIGFQEDGMKHYLTKKRQPSM